MARPKKPKAKKAKPKGGSAPKARGKSPTAARAPARKRKAAQRPAQRPAKRPQRAPKRKRQKKLSRAYEARLRRAGMIVEALGLGHEHIRPIARGHARREQGEVGLAELSQIRQIVRLPSPGQAERSGEERDRDASEIRQAARERVAELAGLRPEEYTRIPASNAHTRMSPAAERFAAVFVALGLGDPSSAYTLWFSP